MNDLMETAGLFDSNVVSFSSLSPKTPAEKAKCFNQVNSPDKRLAEMVNITIKVKDIFCELIEMVDSQTGELVTAPRIVLIDDKGVSYSCVSKGIFSAIRKLVSPSMYGLPSWNPPVPLQVKTITKGEKSILTITVC